MTTAIVEVPVPGREVAITLHEPGHIRGAGFNLHENLLSVPGAPDREEQLVLFVEIDPGLPVRKRTFIVLPTGAGFTPNDGRILTYQATARSERSGSTAHIFEIKKGE